jgi:hypothetical protein
MAESAAFAFHGETNRLYVSGECCRDYDYKNAPVQFTEDGSTFHSLPEMPQRKERHCMAVLSGGNIFVAGGPACDGPGYGTKSCFLYKNETSKWERCPDMMTDSRDADMLTDSRDGAVCGVIKRRDGKEEVVMTGGRHSTV